MKKLIVILFIFQVKFLLAQNLVLNPGFETLGTVPCGWTASPGAFKQATSAWTSPTEGTPDIFTNTVVPSCSNYRPHSTNASSNGDQNPHSGIAFAGLYMYQFLVKDAREYIEGQLSAPLTIGQSYIFSMYVSLGDNSEFATNNMGVNFYTALFDTVSYFGRINANPVINFTSVISDTVNWVLLTDTIVATAPWQYFIIGNFYSDNNTNIVNEFPSSNGGTGYYYVDDVSVTPFVSVPPPVAAFYTADTSICSNSCITFNNLSQNATTYQWSFPAGTPSSSSSGNPGSICYNTPGRYNVQLIADNGVLSDTIVMSEYIGVKALGKLGIITQSRDSICAGSGITSTLTADSTGFTSFQWQSSDNSTNFSDIAAATTTTYITPPSLTQNTAYRITGSNTCGTDTSATVTLYVVPSPVATFNYLINGMQVTFNSAGTSGNVVNYAWDFGDGANSSDANPVHNFNTPDTFDVCLAVYNNSNCSYTHCQNIDLLSTNAGILPATKSIALYPNPANKAINLSTSGIEGNYEIRIYNVLGQLAQAAQPATLTGNRVISIPLTNLPAGTYQLILTNGTQLYTQLFERRD